MNRQWMLVLWAVLSAPAAGMAQGNAWEVEVHGGRLFTPDITGGSGSLPAPGSPFTTTPGFGSRRVSSWFFGDGAQLLNGVASFPVFNTSSRITPLDPVLNNPLADRKGGGSVGFRVSRDITPRVGAEFNFDYASTPFEARASAVSGLNATSVSFRPVFEGILPAALFVGRNPNATNTIQAGDASEITGTGAVRINLLTQGRLIPYATAGAGFTRHRGDDPAATVEGGYSFQLFGVFPFNERDSVSLRQTVDETVFVGVVGGGVNAYLTQRSGIRVDIRAHLGKTTDRVLLDANPSVTTAAAASFIFSVSNPGISFSSFPQPSIFPPSSLSGPAVDDFTTFEVSRTRRQVLLTFGYFVRF